MKICRECNIEKEDIEFEKNKRVCRKCRNKYKSIYNKKYRIKNGDKLRLDSKNYYYFNKDRFKINKLKNKEKVLINAIKYENSYAKYDTYNNKLSNLLIECRRDQNNNKLLQIKCDNCKKWFNPRNRQVKDRIKTILNNPYNKFSFCSKECKNRFKCHLTDEEYNGYLGYKRKVILDLYFVYKKLKWYINPDNLPRGRNQYHIDHIYSISNGFKNNVPVEILNNPFNLRMMLGIENISKLGRSDSTLTELYKDYEFYIKYFSEECDKMSIAKGLLQQRVSVYKLTKDSYSDTTRTLVYSEIPARFEKAQRKVLNSSGEEVLCSAEAWLLPEYIVNEFDNEIYKDEKYYRIVAIETRTDLSGNTDHLKLFLA
jgi:hypothetical protein